jgi:hypothetical protein
MCCCRLLFSLIALPGTRLTALPVSIPSVLLCPTRVAVLLAVSLSAVQRVSQCCFPPETERQRQPTLLPSRRHHGRLLLRPHTTKPAHRLPRLLIAFSRPPSARNHIDAAIIHTRPHAPPRVSLLLLSHTPQLGTMSASGTPQPQQHFNGHPMHNQWNGAHHMPQMHAPNNDRAYAPDAQPGLDASDAIREGKQKAREAMIAAGMGRVNAATPGAYPQNAQQGDASAHMNGGLNLSRKRSRDGTQLPLDQSRTSAEPSEDHKIHDDVLLDRYMQRDLVYGAAVNDQSERVRDLIRNKESEKDFYVNEVRQRRHHNPGSIFGAGYRGFGNGTTNGPTKILYSNQRAPPKGRHAGLLRTSRKDNEQQAEQHEELVPIRLDLELDKLRLRDTFTWNLHEKLVTPELFIQHLIEDLNIPDDDMNSKRKLSEQIRGEMLDQILNYYPHVFVDDGPVEPGRPYFEHKDDEMRIMIKLNITIGRITLIDQFEWDINNPENLPEDFAKNMALENALSGEFTTAIAHSIREQSQLYTRSLWLTNHMFDGRPVEDPDVRDSFLSTPAHSTFRPQQAQKDWMPYMYEMSEAELERTETSMSREHRVQKRQLNRRGGPALPDLKERQRTVRSLLIHRSYRVPLQLGRTQEFQGRVALVVVDVVVALVQTTTAIWRKLTATSPVQSHQHQQISTPVAQPELVVCVALRLPLKQPCVSITAGLKHLIHSSLQHLKKHAHPRGAACGVMAASLLTMTVS